MELAEHDALPIPEEIDPPEESPYLRRQKTGSVRKSRISPRLRIALFAIAVLVPVGLAGYAMATFALTSPIFELKSADQVVVTGNSFVSREEVLGALGLPLNEGLRSGTNVFRMSLDVRRRGVEALPWVRAATVTRILPNGLLVHVTERSPVAYANVGGRVNLVDEEGVLLDKPDAGVFDFPVIYGLENAPSHDERRARLALYMDFTRQVGQEAPDAGWMISEVNLSDGEDLKALLIKGQQTLQVHFGDKNFLSRFRNFLVLLPEIQKSNDKLDSVDLRYRNQVIVDPQPSAQASDPTVTPSPERKD
jgi:cell division protein FtsQ